MGVNNKKRRAAKQRARAQGARRGADAAGGGSSAAAEDLFVRRDRGDSAEELARVSFELELTVRRISSGKLSDPELMRVTEGLLHLVRPTPLPVVATMLSEMLSSATDDIVEGGWTPGDLGELVGRHVGAQHLDLLAAMLHEESRRNNRRTTAWLAAIDRVGAATHLRLPDTRTLASGLRLAALLRTTPTLGGDALSFVQQGPADGPEHPKLARVRALLAKAESTEYDEEAEAFSAKAQELISRYALDKLLGESRGPSSANRAQARRIWLDAPYVGAKASLVHEVSNANRCRAVVTEQLGYCVVIGAVDDLDAVELLVTSLLVQASRAMLRSGSVSDRSGVQRTRSFRRAFLMAYATGIGRRLASASRSAVEESPDALVPVLRGQEERVAEAFAELIPHSTRRTASISNGDGWAAGLAAADLAELNVRDRVAGGSA